MTANPLRAVPQKELSPLDPYECCVWANQRLHPKAQEAGLMWWTDGERIALVKAV